MMSVERKQAEQKRIEPAGWLDANAVLSVLLEEYSAVTDYRTLRDSIPRRLAALLKCRCVLLYQHSENTLHFVSGFFDYNEEPGWSSSLLSVAQINPIDLRSEALEATAWRLRSPATYPATVGGSTHVAVPLLYRQRGIGVLVAIRDSLSSSKRMELSTSTEAPSMTTWHPLDIQVIKSAASIIAMLLENTRLLERDQERIHELSLLNSISGQLNSATLSSERIRNIVIQRAREIANPDICDLLLPAFPALPTHSIPWLADELRDMIFDYVSSQRDALPPGSSTQPLPLIIERPGDAKSAVYLAHLPAQIKTFVAIPLFLSRSGTGSNIGPIPTPTSDFVGVILVAYHRPWKLRSSEKMLLQVLARQASSAFEQLRLVEELIEARNEARKLLRQVLDDQRLKELILESIPSGLITVDQQGLITTFNRAAASILGYHPYEVIGQPLQKLLGELPLARCHNEPLSPGAREYSRALNLSLNHQDRMGHDLFLDLSLVPLRDGHACSVGTLITVTDITAMHRLEEEKRRLDRLASLGEMSASVAHEVRNPLAAMKTTMQMLRSDISEGLYTGADESIKVVLKEIERVDLIVRDLLDFARPRQLHRMECNLPLLCDRVLSLMQAQFEAAGVKIHRLYQPIPPALVDIGQMEQVLLNVYTNALQAMSEGGVLSIACQLSGVQERPGEAPQSWIELSISDTGIGIEPEQRERLFQPFFTTKAHGIGLGLPITRRLIEEHHGQISIESQLGYGATILIRLPLLIASVAENDNEVLTAEPAEAGLQGDELL